MFTTIVQCFGLDSIVYTEIHLIWNVIRASKFERNEKRAAWAWDANNPSLFVLIPVQAAVSVPSVKSNDSL